jgi:E3 ubiquitin-protein ligase HUWE1
LGGKTKLYVNYYNSLQRLRQRAQAVSQEATTNLAHVSPEFLAALPPSIQDEVLAQQRIEQQRQVATASNPNDPVDTEAFFRNLQPSLRQAVSKHFISVRTKRAF